MKRIRISPDRIRTLHLKKLEEHLSVADSKRLDSILPLFDNDEPSAALADCLARLFADKDADGAMNHFRQFRSRLKKQAAAAKSGLELEVDTRKKTPVKQRRCWFTAPDDVASSVADFSKQSAHLDTRIHVESRALFTTSQALEEGKRSIYGFVSSVPADRKLAEDILKRLKEQFKASAKYDLNLWDTEEILLGENRREEIEHALEQSQAGLLLLSPAYLGAQDELGNLGELVRGEKPVLPVVIRKIDPATQQLFGLDERQLFGLEKPFQKCSGTVRKDEFVHGLFQAIVARLEALPGEASLEPELDDEPGEVWAKRRTELLRRFAPRETELFVDPRGAPTSLDAADFDEASLAQLDSQGQNALEFLEQWALDEDGPIFAAVLGEYGMGKTTTLKQFTHRLLDRRAAGEAAPLVIYVDLRNSSESIRRREIPELERFLTEVLRGTMTRDEFALTPKDIIRMTREEGAILIFDGLDEVLVHLDDKQAQDFIRQLWSALPPQFFRGDRETKPKGAGKLVFSCRSHFFKTVRDQAAMLCAQGRDDIRAKDYRACVLLPFNEQQVCEYIAQALGAERVDPVLELFASVHNLTELSRRPFLLNLIREQIGRLEQNRLRGEAVQGVTLYENMAQDWLNRDDGKHHLQKEDKLRLMEDLAAAMWRDGAREWEWSRVHEWFEERVTGDPKMVAKYLGNGMKFDLLDEDFRTSTFVLRPDNKAEDFRFAHSSLQEFFLAAYLRRALRDGVPAHWDLPLLSVETLEFLGQMLATEHRENRRDKCRETLNAILAGQHTDAAKNAFLYWQIAVENSFPIPDPQEVNLAGAKLSAWRVGPIRVAKLDLSGAKLSHSRWRRVQCDEISLEGADAFAVEFEEVRAGSMRLTEANLTASHWRRCQMQNLIGADRAELHAAAFLGSELPELPKAWQRALATFVFGEGAPSVSRSALHYSDASLHPVLGHSSSVRACAWSPDAQQIISASADQSLKIWDAQSHERLKTMGQMVSGVAHDFNNAIAIIMGYSDMFIQFPELINDADEVQTSIETINIAAKDAASIAKRLREFYRPDDEGEEIEETAELRDAAEKAISLTQPRWKNQARAEGRNINIKTDLDPVWVRMDSFKVREILTNLIFNAVDAMPDGGTIKVSSRSEPAVGILEVTDSGTGMPEEVRRRCLEPFFSTKGDKGTGLGLGSVNAMVQRHRGKVDIESQEGEGTTVTITLPHDRRKKNGDKTTSNSLPPPLHVLVVDDEEQYREALRRLLTHDGHTCVTAKDGLEGLAKYHAERFDIVITDRSMPNANGDHLAAAIQRVNSDQPVIMLTGFGDIMKANNEKPCGVDVLLSKPIRIEQLREAFLRVFRKTSESISD